VSGSLHLPQPFRKEHNVTSETQTPTAPSLVKSGALAGLAAGAANVVLFLIGKVVGVAFEVKLGSSTSTVMFLQPLLASFIAVLVGALLLKALSRTARGITIWTVTAMVVFLAYTGFAVSASQTTGTAVMLALMHLVALATAFWWLLPSARRSASV
jgi:hypothetical protein